MTVEGLSGPASLGRPGPGPEVGNGTDSFSSLGPTVADEIKKQIEADALKPAEASGDMGSVKKRPLSELIEADQYLAGKTAASKPHRGIRFTQAVLPGSM